jgi:acetyl-CoA carboxylase/biotin carboxylase 1
MARLDEQYAELKKAVDSPNASPEEKSAATAKLEAREKHLAPSYQSIALEFADLHDRSGRMKAKADCVPCDWENSRRVIYWSLRRKISENVSVLLFYILFRYSAHLAQSTYPYSVAF